MFWVIYKILAEKIAQKRPLSWGGAGLFGYLALVVLILNFSFQ